MYNTYAWSAYFGSIEHNGFPHENIDIAVTQNEKIKVYNTIETMMSFLVTHLLQI